jgi:hypothetical protein
MAWAGSYAVTQLFKFPLAYFIKDPWHTEATRYFAVLVAFLFAHYLSNHLSVPMEIVVACATPIIYAVTLSVLGHFFPWIAVSFLGGVDESRTTK